MTLSADEIRDLERHLTDAERTELYALVDADLTSLPWRPLPGPQTMAYESTADVIGFGGSAGGGKTDLALGLALTQHYRAQIFRREGPQLAGMLDRLVEIVGTRDHLAGKPPVYRDPDGTVQIEFGSIPNPGDEIKYQGRPKDLLVIDEAANFSEAPVRFVKGWVRTTRPGQRKRTLLTFNPPTNSEGRWVVDFFAPWLDDKHNLYPTPPGALRYVYVDPESGKDVWIDDDNSAPFVLQGEHRVYDYNPDDYRPEHIITPESRTFIPSRITDNPYLVSTGYMQQLQALPEPLRSQMLLGDFHAGMEDDPWQVIPTAWVAKAQSRWKERSPKGEMISLGVDVARGGRDNTTIAARHAGMWFDRIKVYKGTETPDGPTVAGLAIAAVRDRAPIHIDVIGVGASPYDVLKTARQDVYGVNVAERALGTDQSGRLQFANRRSELWWRMREALDPANDTGIALPPDGELLKDLCAPKWEMAGTTIQVWSRDKIVEKTGRSPDHASALMLAFIDTPKLRDVVVRGADNEAVLNYDPTQ